MLLNLIKIAVTCLYKGIIFHTFYKLNRGFYPTFAVYMVTMRCNGKCRACNIWKTKNKTELTIEEIDRILKNPFWKQIKYINLTGGQPFLRNDLIDIVHTMKNNLSRMRLIAIPTNGLLTDKIGHEVEAILNLLKDSNVLLSVTVSINGIGKTHDFINQVPNIYIHAMNTLDKLKKLEVKYPNFTTGIETIVCKYNVNALEDINAHNSKITDHLNFTLAMNAPYFENENENFVVRKSDFNKVVKFYRKLKENNPSLAYYYDKVINYLENGKRNYPCLGGYKTICMRSNGDITPCAMLPSVIFGNVLDADPKSMWFRENALSIRKNLKRNNSCRYCLNNCDLINNYTEECFNFPLFLITNPKISLELLSEIKRGHLEKYGNIWEAIK